MGLAISLALLVAIFAAAASRAHAAETAPAAGPPPPGPPKTTADHARAIVQSGDARKIAAAAVAAHQAGEPQLAAELAQHAQKAAAKLSYASRAVVYPSPFTSVATPAWNTWVHALRGDNPRQVTPGNNLGLWAMGMRRLVDLKLATNPHQVVKNGRKVWDADWIDLLQPGPDKFLADPELQYQVFVKSVNDDFARIKNEMPNALGTDVDGVKATPSGLLAVAKLAGVDGLKGWLEDPEKRKKYTTATAIFNKLNGVF